MIVTTQGISQGSDVLLLQKKHRTVGHYFAGSSIIFYTKDGVQIAGSIDSLKRDSIFLFQQSEWMVPNGYGTYTSMKGPKVFMNFAITDIVAFPLNKKRSGFVRSGSIFIIGGTAYLVLNVVNTIREKDAVFGNDNLPRVVGGLSAVTLGFLLQLTQRTKIYIGHQYRLRVLPTTAADLYNSIP